MELIKKLRELAAHYRALAVDAPTAPVRDEWLRTAAFFEHEAAHVERVFTTSGGVDAILI